MNKDDVEKVMKALKLLANAGASAHNIELDGEHAVEELTEEKETKETIALSKIAKECANHAKVVGKLLRRITEEAFKNSASLEKSSKTPEEYWSTVEKQLAPAVKLRERAEAFETALVTKTPGPKKTTIKTYKVACGYYAKLLADLCSSYVNSLNLALAILKGPK